MLQTRKEGEKNLLFKLSKFFTPHRQSSTLRPLVRFRTKFILLLPLILLLVGGAAAFYLVKVNQDIRQQASTDLYTTPSPSAQPSAKPTLTPTPGVKKCFLSSTNAYVDPGTTACGGTKQCVECQGGQWLEVDRSKCSGDPYCGPNINCSYAKHGEYACLSMSECVRCWDGETQRNQSGSNCPAPCGNVGVTPRPTKVPASTPIPTPKVTIKPGSGGTTSKAGCYSAYTGGCPAGLEAAQSSQCGGCDTMQVCCVKTEQCNCNPGEVQCNYDTLKTCKSDCKTWTEQKCPTGYQCYNNQCTDKSTIGIGTGSDSCRFNGQACKSEYFEETTRAGLTLGKAKCYYSTCVGTGEASACTGSKKCVSFTPIDATSTTTEEKTDQPKTKSKTEEKLAPTATPIPAKVVEVSLKQGEYCGIFANKKCLPGLECKGLPRTCQEPKVDDTHQGGEKTGGIECNLGEHKCQNGVEYTCSNNQTWGNPSNCAYGCGNQACLLPTPTPIPPYQIGETVCKGQGEQIGILAGSSCCPGLEGRLSNFLFRCEPIKDVSCREAFVQACNFDNNGNVIAEKICYFTKQDTKTGLCNLNVKDCGPCQTGKVANYRDKANGVVCNANYECQSNQCIPDVQGHKTCQEPGEIKKECSSGETKCEWWNSSYWQYNCQQGTFVRSSKCDGGCSGSQCAANVCTYPSSQCSADGTKLLICKQTQIGYLEYNCEGGCEAGICQEKEKCGLFNPCKENFKCAKGQCIPEGAVGNACKGPAFIMPCTYPTSQGTVEVGEQFCWYSQLDKNGQCTQNQVCENVCSPTGSIVQENRTPAYPTATPTKVPPTPIPTASSLADLLAEKTPAPSQPIIKPSSNQAIQDLTDNKELTLSQLEQKTNLSQEEVTNLMNAKFSRSYQALVDNDLDYLRNQCKAELGDSNTACTLSSEKILKALYPKIETAYIFDQVEEDKAFTQNLNQKFGIYLAGGYTDLQVECVSLTGKPELCSNEQQVLQIVVPGVSEDQVKNIITYKQEETKKYRQIAAKVEEAQTETINTYLSTDMQVLYNQCRADNPNDYQKCSTQEGILAYLAPSLEKPAIAQVANQKRLVEQENRNLEQLYQDYLGGRNVQDLVEQKCQLVTKTNGQIADCQGDSAGKVVFGLDDAQLALRKENITSRILNRDSEWASEALIATKDLQGVDKFSYNLMTTMASSNWFGNSVENYVNVQTDFANQYTGGDKFLATLELSGAVMEKVAIASAVVAVPALGITAAAGGASALGVGATLLGTTQVSLASSNFFGAGSQTAAVCRTSEDALNDPACLQQGANFALAGANFVLAPVTGSLTAAKQGVQLTGLMGSGAQGIIGTAQTATSLVASNAQQLGYGLGLANTTLATVNAAQSQQLTDWASVGGSVLNTVAGTAGLFNPNNAALNLGTDLLADVSGSMLDYYALQNTANLNPNDQFAQTRAFLGLAVGLGQAGFEVQSDVSNFRNSQPVRSLGGADVPKLDPLVKTQQTLLDVAKLDNAVKLDTTLSDPYYAKAKYYEDLVKANQTDIEAIVGKLSKEPNLPESEKLALATVRDNLIKQNTDLTVQKDNAYKIYETRQQEQDIRLAKAILPETVIADAQIKLEAAQTQKQIIEQQKIELESKIAKVEESVKIAEQIGDVTQAEQIKTQRGELEAQLAQADAELAKVNQEFEQQKQAIEAAVAKAQAEGIKPETAKTAEGAAQPETVKTETEQVAQVETTKPAAQPGIFQRIQETVGGWFGRGGQTVSTQEVKTETAKVEEAQKTAQPQEQPIKTQAEVAQELQAGFNQAKQSIQEIAQTEGDVRKLTEKINSFDNAIRALDSKLNINPDNQSLINQRANLEQQKLQLQQNLDSVKAKAASLNQDDNLSKPVLAGLTTIRPETTAQSTKNQAEQLRNQVATELGKKSASEVDLTKIEADLISQNGGQRTLAVEQQLNQALRKLKQATLLDTVADLQQKFASLDQTSVEALRVISDIDQLLQTRELDIPQVSSDPQKNLQIENIIRSAELRAGQSEGIAFFNTRSNQLSTLAQILSSPKVAVELTTAGGKSFVGGLVLEIQKTVYGRDKGIYIAKAGGEADIANQLRAMSPEGTKVVEFDQNKFLQDKAYQAEVLAADYLVSNPDQIQFLRNTAHNYSLGSTRDVAVSLYKNLSSNVGVYVDELQINMDPSRQAINPTGESSKPIAQNQKDAANLVGESILDTGLINRWGSGDHAGVLTVREADGAEVARFTDDTLDKIFTQLKVKNGESSAFKGMSETEISDLVDYVRSNAQELEILSSNTNALTSRLEAAGFKDSSAQANQVLDQIDQINSFAQGLKMKFGVDYFRDVDSQLQANNANNRTKDPVTIPASGGVKNEGQSYTASLQAAMEFIGAKAYAQANPGVNNAASKVNFDGLTSSPETAYRSTFADYLADLNNSSVGAVTGAFADGRGVVETTLGFDTYRDTEAVEKIVNTADTDIGARINKDRSYMASGLEDSTQLIVDLIRSGKLAQSNGLASNDSVKYVIGSDDVGDTMRIAQADAQGRDFSDRQRYFVQQGGDHYVEVAFVRTVDSAGNETISRRILNDNLDAKGVQKLYQDNPANMTIVIGRGGATGDSIRTEGNVPGVTLVSKNSPEGLVAQAGARLDRGTAVAEQYAIILDSTRSNLDLNVDATTRLASANEFDFQEFRQSINEAQLRVEQLKTTQGLDNGIESASTRVLAELSMSADAKIASWASAKLLEMSSNESRRNVDLVGGSQDTLVARQAKLASAQSKWQDLFSDSANQSILKYIETNNPQAFARMRSNVEVDANRLAYADQNAPISKEAVVNSGDLSEYLLQHNATVKKTDDVAKVAAGNNAGRTVATGVVAPSMQPTLLAGTRRIITAVADNFSTRQSNLPKGGLVNTALFIPRTMANGLAAFLDTTWPTVIKPAFIATYLNKPTQPVTPKTETEKVAQTTEQKASTTKPTLGERLSGWWATGLIGSATNLTQWWSGGLVNAPAVQKVLSTGLISLFKKSESQPATPVQPGQQAQPVQPQAAAKAETNIQNSFIYKVGNWFGGIAKDLGFGQKTTTPEQAQPEVEQPGTGGATQEEVKPAETVIFGGVEFPVIEIKERTTEQKTTALTKYLADRGLGQYSANVRALSNEQIANLYTQVFENKEIYTHEQAIEVLLNFLGVKTEAPAQAEQPDTGGTTQEEVVKTESPVTLAHGSSDEELAKLRQQGKTEYAQTLNLAKGKGLINTIKSVLGWNTFAGKKAALRDLVDGKGDLGAAYTRLVDNGVVKPAVMMDEVNYFFGIKENLTVTTVADIEAELRNYQGGEQKAKLTEAEISDVMLAANEVLADYVLANGENSRIAGVEFARDMARLLSYQILRDKQVFSGSDHGNNHIVRGNLNKGLALLESVSKLEQAGLVVTAKDRLAFVVATLLHDMGYTTGVAQAQASFEASKDHPIFSAAFIKANQSYFERHLGKASFEAVYEAILLHSYPNYDADFRVESDGVHPEMVHHVLAIVDALGTTAETKAPEAFKIPAVLEKLNGIRLYKQLLIEKYEQQFAGLEAEEKQDQINAAVKAKLKPYVEKKKQEIIDLLMADENLAVDRRNQYIEAVKNQFNEVTVDLTLPTYTGLLDEVTFMVNEQGKIVPKVNMRVSSVQALLSDLFGEDFSVAAFKKAMEDLGMTSEQIKNLGGIIKDYRSANDDQKAQLRDRLTMQSERALFTFDVDSLMKEDGFSELFAGLMRHDLRMEIVDLINKSNELSPNDLAAELLDRLIALESYVDDPQLKKQINLVIDSLEDENLNETDVLQLKNTLNNLLVSDLQDYLGVEDTDLISGIQTTDWVFAVREIVESEIATPDLTSSIPGIGGILTDTTKIFTKVRGFLDLYQTLQQQSQAPKAIEQVQPVQEVQPAEIEPVTEQIKPEVEQPVSGEVSVQAEQIGTGGTTQEEVVATTEQPMFAQEETTPTEEAQTVEAEAPAEEVTTTTTEENYPILPYEEVVAPLVPYGGYPSLPSYAQELAAAREQQEYLAQMAVYDQPSTVLVTTTVVSDLAGTEELEQGDTRTVNQTPALPNLTNTEVVKEYLPVLYDSRAVEFNWLVDAVDQVVARITGQKRVDQFLETFAYSPVMQSLQAKPALEADLTNYPIVRYQEAPLARMAETISTFTENEVPAATTAVIEDRGPIRFGQAIPLMGSVDTVQNLFEQYQAWLARRATLANLADQYNITAYFATHPVKAKEGQGSEVENQETETVAVESGTEAITADQTNYPIVLTAEQANYPLARIEGREYLEAELAQADKQAIVARDTVLKSVYNSIPVGSGPINSVLALLPQYQAFVKAQTANQQHLGKMFKAWADQLAKLKTESTEEVAAETALTEPVVEEPSPELTLEEQLEQVKAQIAELDQQIAEINAEYDPRYKAYNDGLNSIEKQLYEQKISASFRYNATNLAGKLKELIGYINWDAENDLSQIGSHLAILETDLATIFNEFNYIAGQNEENEALNNVYKKVLELIEAYNWTNESATLTELIDTLNNEFIPKIEPYLEDNQEVLATLSKTLEQRNSALANATTTYQQAHQAEKEQIEALRAKYRDLDTQKTALLKQANYLTEAIVKRDNDLVAPNPPTAAVADSYAPVEEVIQVKDEAQAAREQLLGLLKVIPGLNAIEQFVANIDQVNFLTGLVNVWTASELSLSQKVTETFKVLPESVTPGIANQRFTEILTQAESLEDLHTRLEKNFSYGNNYWMLVNPATNQIEFVNLFKFIDNVDDTLSSLNNKEFDEDVSATLADWPNYAPIRAAGQQLVAIALAQRKQANATKAEAFYADYRQQQEQLINRLEIKPETKVAELKTLAQNPPNQKSWLTDNNQIVGADTVVSWLDRIDFENVNQVIPADKIPLSALREKVQALLDLRKSEQARKAAEKYQQAQTAYSKFLLRLNLSSETTAAQLEVLASNQDLTIDDYLKMFGLTRDSEQTDFTAAKRALLNPVHPDNYEMLGTAYLFDKKTNLEMQALLANLAAATKLLNRALIDLEEYFKNPEAYLRKHNSTASSQPSTDFYTQIKKAEDAIKSTLYKARNLDELIELMSKYEETRDMVDDVREFVEGKIKADRLLESYGIRDLAKKLLAEEAEERASYIDKLNKLPIFANLMPLISHSSTTLDQLREIWNTINGFRFGNFDAQTLEGTDVRFNFSLLMTQIERILNLSGSLYRRPINEINNAQNVQGLLDFLTRYENEDIFLDDETFYTSEELKAEKQSLIDLRAAWNTDDYNQVDVILNNLRIAAIKNKVLSIIRDRYQRNINDLYLKAVNAKTLAELRNIFNQSPILYYPSDALTPRATILTSSYLVSSLDNGLVQNLPTELQNIVNKLLTQAKVQQAAQQVAPSSGQSVSNQTRTVNSVMVGDVHSNKNRLVKLLQESGWIEFIGQTEKPGFFARIFNFFIKLFTGKDPAKSSLNFEDEWQLNVLGNANSISFTGDYFDRNRNDREKTPGIDIIKLLWKLKQQASKMVGVEFNMLGGNHEVEFLLAMLLDENEDFRLLQALAHNGVDMDEVVEAKKDPQVWEILQNLDWMALRVDGSVMQHSDVFSYADFIYPDLISGIGWEKLADVEETKQHLDMILQRVQNDQLTPQQVVERINSNMKNYVQTAVRNNDLNSIFRLFDILTLDKKDSQFLNNPETTDLYLELFATAANKGQNRIYHGHNQKLGKSQPIYHDGRVINIDRGMGEHYGGKGDIVKETIYAGEQPASQQPSGYSQSAAQSPQAQAAQPTFTPTTITIGRGDGGLRNYQINDERVSSRHAKISNNSQGQWFLVDTSTNGTFLYNVQNPSGQRVYGSVEIKNGDVIKIINQYFKIKIDGNKVSLEDVTLNFSGTGSYNTKGCSSCPIAFGEFNTEFTSFFIAQSLANTISVEADKADLQALNQTAQAQVAVLKNMANDHTFDNAPAQETLDALAETADAMLKKTEAEKAQAIAEMAEAFQTIDQAISQITAAQDSAQNQAITDLTTLKNELKLISAELEALQVKPSNRLAGVFERINIQLEEIALYVKRISGDVSRLVRPEEEEETGETSITEEVSSTKIKIGDQEIEALVLGKTDPSQITAENLDQLFKLYHGASKKLIVDENYDFFADEDAPDGSYTIGAGLYTTDNHALAEEYANLRAKQNLQTETGVLTTLVPYQAKMLDLRNGQSLPEPLFKAWVEFMQAKFAQKKAQYEAISKPDGIEEMMFEFEKRYYDFLVAIAAKEPDQENRQIHYVLATRFIPEYNMEVGLGSSQNFYFAEFMKNLGFDGLISQEPTDIEGMIKADSFVFFNYSTIGSVEDWQRRSETESKIEENKETGVLEQFQPTFAEQLTELVNVLGVEDLDFDSSKPAKEILAELMPKIGNEEIFSIEAENPEKELMRLVTYHALQTAYQRLNPSGVEEINQARERIKDLEKDESPLVKREREDLIFQLLRQNVLTFPSGDYSYVKHPHYSFLQPSESNEYDCIAQTAYAISVLYNLGKDRNQIRTALSGFHLSALYNDASINQINVYDPRTADRYSLTKATNDNVPNNDFFSKYSIESIKTALDFVNETDHLGFLEPSYQEARQNIHFMTPEDGFLAAFYTHLGRTHQEEENFDKAEEYYQIALMFDPENSYIAAMRSLYR